MSQKSFEDIENKIREAAANSEPAFDEQAWLKMKLLLNKEDSKKRRFFIWRRYGFPILLMGVGLAGYWYFNHTHGEKNKPETVTAAKSTVTKNQQDLTIGTRIELNVQQKINTAIDKEKGTSGDATLQLKDAAVVSNKTSRMPEEAVIQQQDAKDDHLPVANTAKVKNIRRQKKGVVTTRITDSQLLTEIDATLTSNEVTWDNTIEKKQPIITTAEEINDLATEKIIVDSIKNEVALKDTDPTTAGKKLVISADKSGRKSSSAKRLFKWYLLASVGAEVSGVKFLSFPNSPVTPRYGAGIGLQVNKKISVQTGFYAGRKKYIGGPGDYHAKPGSYWGLVEIKKVEASCLMYDIPVTIRYNIVQKPSFIFYGTAGISSFIMKKEDYNYHYNYNNNYYVRDKSYTGNKNLFSVLSVSGGIEKKLGTQFSILAEPYLSFPLSGVGEGSVKLYSAGLQFGLKYLPFFK